MFLDLIDETGNRVLINTRKILTITFETRDYPRLGTKETRIRFELDGRIVYRIEDTERNRGFLKHLDITGGNNGERTETE